ncbi:MAG: hypothetical protein AAFQ80_14985 [Cyanobacteria bacterium J06621_8]
MSDQEINIHTHTDVDGMVHLDIPVGIIDQDINLTISYSISEPERKQPDVDHLLGAFDSRDGQQYSIEETKSTAFEQAVIEKLAQQGVELP